MGRPPRIDHAGAWHHVMNRGARHQPIFQTDSDRGTFLWLLARIRQQHGIEAHGYCLMDNHFHVLIRSRDGELSNAMQHLGAEYVRLYNRRHQFDGPLFRGRFQSKLIDRDDYLLAVSRYIHRNPVEAGLTAHAAGHRWSSHRWYVEPTGGPRWLETSFVLGMLGHDRERYHRFVAGGTDDAVDIDSFEGPDRDDDATADLERIDRIVQALTGDSTPTIRPPDHTARRGRTVAVLLASECSNAPTATLVEHYAFGSANNLRQYRHRAQRRRDRDAELRLLYDTAWRRLHP